MKYLFSFFFLLPLSLFSMALTHEEVNDPKYAYMDEIIEKELYPYTHSPIKGRLIRKYRRIAQNEIKYYCIHNGKISGSGHLLPLLAILQSSIGLPDLELLSYEGVDTSPPKKFLKILKGQLPLIAESKRESSHGIALFSNPLLEKTSLHLQKQLLTASSKISWENKCIKVVVEDLSKLPLTSNPPMKKTLEYGKAHPELLEFFLPSLAFPSERDLDNASSAIKINLSLPLEEQINYKYHLIIGSNRNALHNQLWRFFSNSLIFISDLRVITWRSSLLKPWVHYVPVQNECTNLMYQVGWAITHDATAKKIAQNGQDFALNYLEEKHSYIYAYKFLCRYAKLYTPTD